MRTLVVSDLHIGARHGRSRLDDDAVIETLAAAAARTDRLVLLGDVLELRQNPMRDALAAASRVLPRVVAGMGDGHEIVLVAGNHDHELFAAWATRRAAAEPPAAMTLETAVDWKKREPLAALARMLESSGASLRATYPGVWLREDVYATHGHYLDRHTTAPGFERLGAGAMGKLLKISEHEMSSPDAYERILAPIYAWMLAISEHSGAEIESGGGGGSTRILQILREGGLKGRSMQVGVSGLAKLLQLAGLGELSGKVSGPALYRTELRGFGSVVANLDIQAQHVLFGHTHRAGPLPGDDSELWTAPGGASLMNSGCWVQEGAAFMSDEERALSAYRAGFAIELDDDDLDNDAPPRLVNLLDA